MLYDFVCTHCIDAKPMELSMSMRDYTKLVDHTLPEEQIPVCHKCALPLTRLWNTNSHFTMTAGGTVGSKKCYIKPKRG